MKKVSFGATIATLRKQQGMTQLELAQKMGVTDKAVSKWERDLSFPDAASLPRLAEIFGCSVDGLMQVHTDAGAPGLAQRAGGAGGHDFEGDSRRHGGCCGGVGPAGAGGYPFCPRDAGHWAGLPGHCPAWKGGGVMGRATTVWMTRWFLPLPACGQGGGCVVNYTG